MPPEIHDGKEQIAQLRFHRRLARTDRPHSGLRLQLRRFLLSFGSRSRQWGQSKPAFCAFAPSFAASASAGIARCTASSREPGPSCSDPCLLPLRRLLRCLDLFPVPQHLGRRPLHRRIHNRLIPRRPRSLFAKHMRMPPNQLAIQVIEHIGDGEVPLVRRHLRIEQHLQQQVAQFFGEMRKVAPLDGVEDFVGLFQRVFANGVERLLAVPGASARCAQPRHDARPTAANSSAARAGSVTVAAGELSETGLSEGRSIPLQSTLSQTIDRVPLVPRTWRQGMQQTHPTQPRILNSRMIRILGTIFAGLLGLAFGSFLNVCLSRWPADESIIRPRSHCRNCDHTLTWWENIPVLSWIILRGRCRSCHAAISWRYPLVELAIGLLWAYIASGYYPDVPGDPIPTPFLLYVLATRILKMLFVWLLVALASLDAEHFWLPNFLTLSGTAIGFVSAVLDPFILLKLDSLTGLPLMEGMRFGLWTPGIYQFLAIFAAASLILLIRWLYQLIRHQEGIGLGDAKLMAMLAAWLGLPGALLSFVLGSLLAALAALVVIAIPSGRTNPQSWATSKLPLGTFLCIGGIVSSLWGQPIIAAYLRWAGF